MAMFKSKTRVVSAVQLLWSTWNEMCAHTGSGEEGVVGCYVDRETRKITEDANALMGMKIPPQLAASHCLAIETDWVIRLDDGRLAVIPDDIFRETFDALCVEHECSNVAATDAPPQLCAQHLTERWRTGVGRNAQVVPVEVKDYVRRQMSDVDAVSEAQHALAAAGPVEPGVVGVNIGAKTAEALRENEELRRSTDFEIDWGKYPKLASVFEHRPQVNVYWGELRELLREARADAVRIIRDINAEELAKARAEGRAEGQPEIRTLEQMRKVVRAQVDVFGKYDALLRFWPVHTMEIQVRRLSTPPMVWSIANAPSSGEALRKYLTTQHGKREETEYELRFYDACDRTIRAIGRVVLPSTLDVDPGAVSVRELDDKQLITALRNVGCYLDDCDACAEVFFTGSKTHDHTCPKGQ